LAVKRIEAEETRNNQSDKENNDRLVRPYPKSREFKLKDTPKA
jgi:hypothetical protein